MKEIPTYVLDDLEEVRDSGAYNMLSKLQVLQDCGIHTNAWFLENPNDYMDALIKMGERRSESIRNN